MHAGNVAFVAPVVIKGWTNVLAIKSVGSHVASLVGIDVGKYLSPNRRKRC